MKIKFDRQRSHRAQFAPQSATIFKQLLSPPQPPQLVHQKFLLNPASFGQVLLFHYSFVFLFSVTFAKIRFYPLLCVVR